MSEVERQIATLLCGVAFPPAMRVIAVRMPSFQLAIPIGNSDPNSSTIISGNHWVILGGARRYNQVARLATSGEPTLQKVAMPTLEL
jgi:hypothetical protein